MTIKDVGPVFADVMVMDDEERCAMRLIFAATEMTDKTDPSLSKF